VSRAEQKTRGAVAALAALALAGALVACGEDETLTSPSPEPVATTPEPSAEETDQAPSAPQSAGDDRPPAPDDVIEDRPGGPGDAGPQAGTRPPSASDARRIEASVKRYIAALNADDGAALCALLAPGALRGVELPERRDSCAATMTASIGHPPPDRAPRWLATRQVDADSVVLVRGGDGRLTGTVVHRFAGREPSIEEDVIYLRRSNGAWRLAKPSATFYRAIGARDVPITALTPPRQG